MRLFLWRENALVAHSAISFQGFSHHEVLDAQRFLELHAFQKNLVDPKSYAKTNTEEQTKHY